MPIMQQLPEKDTVSLVDYLPEFFDAFEAHINQSQDRWGNVWLQRPILENQRYDDQDVRIYDRFDDYFEEAALANVLLDKDAWLNVIGNAFIALTRLEHPELFPDGQTHPYYGKEKE